MNPLSSTMIEKRCVVFCPFPDKIFADIRLDCQICLFKWKDILDIQNDEYIDKELKQFILKCKENEESIIQTINMLKLPI